MYYTLSWPPEWHSGLRHCIAVLKASLQTRVWSYAFTAGPDRETHEVAHSWPSIVQFRGGFGPAGISFFHHALAAPCGGPGAPASWLRSPAGWWSLQHIGAAGFRVKRTVCQEAVRLGRVVFRRSHGSWPSPLPSPSGSCSDGTRL